MTMTRSDIKDLLRPGLNAIFGALPTYPAQYPEIYTTRKSDYAQEYIAEVRTPGLASIKNEGTPTAVDNGSGERTLSTFLHRTVSIMVSLSHESIMDNLYRRQFSIQAIQLKKSLEQTKDILGADIFNNGWNTAYPIADGKPLFSTEHPIDNNVVANTFANNTIVDLGETSLENAITSVQNFRAQNNMREYVKVQKIGVHRELQFRIIRLLDSTTRTGTANREVNAFYQGNYVPKGFFVNQFFEIPNMWILFTEIDNGCLHFQREAVETDMQDEFSTSSLLIKGQERYSFGVANFRAAFGSMGV